MKENNKLHHSLLIVIGVLLTLFALQYLPPIKVGETALKRISLLKDVQFQAPPTAPPVSTSIDSLFEQADSLSAMPEPQAAPPLPAPPHLVPIEEYADTLHPERQMSQFYAVLHRAKTGNEKVRIAYLGDSFVEGDILTADLRAMLQKEYGGCGVGFVPIASPVSAYRASVRHTFKHWDTYTLIHSSKHQSVDSTSYFLSGNYSRPQQGAWAQYVTTSAYGSRQKRTEQLHVLYKGHSSTPFHLTINDTLHQQVLPASSPHLQDFILNTPVRRLRLACDSIDSLHFMGVSLEGKSGIVLDNFGLRGCYGLQLLQLSDSLLKEIAQVRPYNLLILHYGLNALNEQQEDYAWYYAGMCKLVRKLHRCFPTTPILLISISDRDYKTPDGEIRTLPSMSSFLKYQKAVALTEHTAYWNLFEAMGGENSMSTFVHHQPSWANYDYTHINARGGKQLAKKLNKAIQYGYEASIK